MRNLATLVVSLALSLLLWNTVRAEGAATATKQSCLPDTGQTLHYTQTFGEDSDFSGSGPSYVDNGDGTVTDQVTGLMWQNTDGGEMTWERAKEYARKLDLAGHKDWRLPNTMELFSIANHDRNRPAVDTKYFTRTEADYWWTNTTRVNDDSRIWVVNSGGGTGAHPKQETLSAGGDHPFHVRCVRGDSPFGAGPLLNDNGDGTVTDQRTGLIWQKIGPEKGMTWEEALKYCIGLKLTRHDDWRLPNIKELRSLGNDGRAQPSLDKAFFPAAQAAYYWSSTTQCNIPEHAWFVDFASGLASYADKSEQHLVLAVRAGVAVPGERVKPVPVLKRSGGKGKDGKGKDGKGRDGKGRGGEKGGPEGREK